jgi:hypothetical protein
MFRVLKILLIILLFVIAVVFFTSCGFLNKGKRCERKMARIEKKCPEMFQNKVDTVTITVTVPEIRVDTHWNYKYYYDSTHIDSVLEEFLSEHNITATKEVIYKLRDLSCDECLKSIFLGEGMFFTSNGVTSRIFYQDGHISNEIIVDERDIKVDTVFTVREIYKEHPDSNKRRDYLIYIILGIILFIFYRLWRDRVRREELRK